MDRNEHDRANADRRSSASPSSRRASQNLEFETIAPAPSTNTHSRLQIPAARPDLTTSQSSIRIRRVPSREPPPQQSAQLEPDFQRKPVPLPKDDGYRPAAGDDAITGRRRSSSEPQRYLHPTELPASRGRNNSTVEHMPNVQEEPIPIVDESGKVAYVQPKSQGRLRRAAGSLMNLKGGNNNANNANNAQSSGNSYNSNEVNASNYGSNYVDVLDVIDPEVSTLSTLTNVQNSLFVPDLGRFLNRRPTYDLSRTPTASTAIPPTIPEGKKVAQEARRPVSQAGVDSHELQTVESSNSQGLRPVASHTTIKSTLSDSRYAVLPHGAILEGWSDADKQELNDHVRHMLHSRRAKFRRGMRGFGKYVSKPLGFLVTLYATLITLFGLAWVLFLIGWVNVGGKQLYVINIIDNVLVALFAIMGDGLAPFRAVDTYHMCFIAHYHHLTWRLRKEKALPELQDHNDLPPLPGIDEERLPDEETDLERGEKQEASVLNEKQQKRLKHHQDKFSSSHTFYRPHETSTHHAFPLRLLVAVVVLLDCHSLFQIALGTCTWSINYKVRPFALTTVILCCSIVCNITAGVLIMVGGRISRKKDVVERMFRQELTEEAIEKVKRRQERERKRLEEREQEVREEQEQEEIDRLRQARKEQSSEEEQVENSTEKSTAAAASHEG